jgi:hypothetical protein
MPERLAEVRAMPKFITRMMPERWAEVRALPKYMLVDMRTCMLFKISSFIMLLVTFLVSFGKINKKYALEISI